ncbi:restriction endonuclease subunit S [Collinsella tanakaei]|uniref:restriction endonuclease subunit S n=1 Tax=Collinsella tanakaei TaxID=626935 RepID=UPI0025A4C3C2|nr:restriction endonuclease subunit S [Collinsella tanakaei]MDM8246802.1 restriction endonuclease subunit S [Collinsella tanakaei]
MIKVKLGSLLDVKRGMSLSGRHYATQGRYIRLTLGNFDYMSGGFKEDYSKDKLYYIGPIRHQYVLDKGDLITPLTEQVTGLLGEIATIPIGDTYIQSGDIGRIVPNREKIDKRFAAYLVSSPGVKKQLAAASQQTKIRHTSPDAIKNCDVWIPEDIRVQSAIANLMDCINDKIALNKRLCSELEETAQLVYDYWFTQFDFPDENGRPYRSSGGKMVYNDTLRRDIPAGWDVIKVCDLVSVMKGISYKSDDLFGDGVPMVSLASFNTDGTYRPETIKSYSGKIDERRTVQPGDLIMCVTQQTSIDLTGKTNVIGKALLMPDIFDGVAVISTDVVKLIPSNPLYAYVLERLFRRLDIHKHIVGYANGTKIKHLDVEGALDFYFPMPATDLRVLATFAQLRMEQAAQYSSLLRENDELIRLRDWLLPMLMNGQVKVCVDGGTHRVGAGNSAVMGV